MKVLFAYFTLALIASNCFSKTEPNIVFILTDDQGYGDLSCHGIQGSLSAQFETNLNARSCKMQTWLKDSKGLERGAFYVQIEKL